jgi:cation diffusion facilitator family transporter
MSVWIDARGTLGEADAMDKHLRYPIYLSILAGVVTIGLKTTAWALTGSVSLLSDAAESVVNLLAAVTAALSLIYAARPVDRDHTYGHQKIEFFSSGLEGVLIFVAALAIGWAAVSRLLTPQPLETLGLGMTISMVAALINGAVGILLLRVGRRHRSIVLEADGKHLLTDVWTSAGVLVGLSLVAATGWNWLDPVIALVVAANIVWTAWELMRKSFDGLMDHALPEEEQAAARQAIEGRLGPGMAFHALRTRQAGARRFLDFHLLVPGDYTVRHAHALGEEIEAAVKDRLPDTEVTVHIEPIDEPGSWKDSALLAVEGNGKS